MFAEFAQPPLQDFLPVLPEEEPVTEDVISQLLSAVEHPGLRPSNAQRLLNFYLLGRVMFSFGPRAARRVLRHRMSSVRVYYVARIAFRCFELFSASGIEYLYVSSRLTPNVLSDMYAADFDALYTYVMLLGMQRLMGQASQGEDDDTAGSGSHDLTT